MLDKFEHLAANSMMGQPDAPPRHNGAFQFDQDWQRRAFGMALALAKDGHYEWEEFRQALIAAIRGWEDAHALDDPSWNYYVRWLEALEGVASRAGIVTPDELDGRAAALDPCAGKHREEAAATAPAARVSP